MAKSLIPNLFGRDDAPLGSLFREVEKAFESFQKQWPSGNLPDVGMSACKVDVSEGKDAVTLTAELPGVEEKDVSVALDGRMLSIAGEKKVERDEKDKDWHVVERSVGSFRRAFTLPFDPDPDKVEAKFEKGVLTVTVPKPADAGNAQRRIAIKAG